MIAAPHRPVKRAGVSADRDDLTGWQRLVRRRLLAIAGKRPDEPLSPADWDAYFVHSPLLARFYAAAERVLFPEAIVDKLVGDQVMALYIPALGRMEDPKQVMLEHAHALLAALGYGTDDGPFLEAGIGLDFGDAFVGNVGQRWVYDFTAVGDVVNTAFRLQGCADGGEVVASSRLADRIGSRPAEPVDLELKGRREPVSAFRFRPMAESAR
jgi:adenylate cyclase